MNAMLKVYLNVLNILTNEEEGQGMAEYGLIIALVVVVIVAVMAIFSDAVSGVFNNLQDAMTP